MARDKDGHLIVRNATSQRAVDVSVDKVRRNWDLDPLSAIPEADGLRPTDLDNVSMKFVRYIAYISEYEKDVGIVQTMMIKERDRRLKSGDKYKEKDKRLKERDLEAIYKRHYQGRSQALQEGGGMGHKGGNSQEHRRESSQYQIQAGKDQKSVPSTCDSGEIRTSEGSSSGSSTPLLHSIHVMQLEGFDDVSTSRKRRELTDGHVSPRVTKRLKPLVTESGQVTELQPPSPFRVDTLSSGLRKVSPGHHCRPDVVEDEASEDGVITERFAREKSLADEAVLFDAQPRRKPLEFGKRNLSYNRDLRRPTISPLSDGPTEPLASKPPMTTVGTPRDPLHHMLDKITTGFTDNLFFFHGILRTHADMDTARARGEALEAAAADVLKSMDIFRKRVELISEGVVEQTSLVPLQNTPATLDKPSEPPAPAGGPKMRGAEKCKHGKLVYPRPGGRSCSPPQKSWTFKDLDVETKLPKDFPERCAESVSRKPDTGKTNPTLVPRATYRALWEELFINPWLAETR